MNAPELALYAAETVHAAGIPIIEITLTVPGALKKVIGDLARRYPDLAVGAGTVLSEELARQCIDAGAGFIASRGISGGGCLRQEGGCGGVSRRIDAH